MSGAAAAKNRKSSAKVLEAISGDDPNHSVPDLLQFACGEYYCMEGETHCEIKIERLGNPDGAAQVEYFTVDGSAKAGVKFVAAKGIAKFEPQQAEYLLKIELVEDDSFDSVLEFEVHLANPVGASLDNYLKKCEITIADDDTFPTNVHKEDILNGDHAKISATTIMMQYFRMHMQDKKLWRTSVISVFCDQAENLRMIWNLYLIKYLIDFLLNVKPGVVKKPPFKFLEPSSFAVAHQVYVIIFFMILPHTVMWLLDQKKVDRRKGGMARMRLQQNLMRKFLNYNEVSRSKVSHSDLTMAVTRDVPELVKEGLLMIFPIFQKLSLLIMYGVMAVLARPVTAVFFIAFPVCMLTFLKIRLKKTEEITEQCFDSQTEMVSFVQKVTDFFRTISDYGQKQETVEKFRQVAQRYNDKHHEYHKRGITNHAFAPLLTSLIIAAYIIMFWEDCRDTSEGSMQIGEFITGVGIWRGIGGCYQGIYENVLTIQDSLSCLHNVVYYMNLPLDICDRAKCKRHLLVRLDEAQDAAAGLFYEGKTTDNTLVQFTTDIISGSIVEKAYYSQDLIQIDCTDLNFTYPAQGDVPEKHIFVNANFEISQGQLVALIGNTGSGKATLLELLAGVLVPQVGSGLAFVPPHLRVLHLTREPMLFHDCSLLDNLLYGEVTPEDHDPQRVMRICRRMGMSQEVLDAIGNDESEAKIHAIGKSEEAHGARSVHAGTGNSVADREVAEQKAYSRITICYNDRCLIHLARALIVNPDVLLVHKPLTHFNGTDVECVMETFREFVDLRGFETPVALRRQRRPRTCIMSLATMDQVDRADLVLEVANHIVQEVDMNMVSNREAWIRELIRAVDGDNDGIVNRDEFIAEMYKQPELAKLFDVPEDRLSQQAANDELGMAFDKLDFESTGSITSEELLKSLQHQLLSHVPTKGHDRNATKPAPAAPGLKANGLVDKVQHRKAEEVALLEVPPMPDIESAMPVFPLSTPNLAPAAQWMQQPPTILAQPNENWLSCGEMKAPHPPVDSRQMV